jgi:uncharacterized BrkB/YihY/UPF0761 family membrane protein
MLFEFLSSIIALVAGAGIGYSFGLLQQAALRRNEQLQQTGKLNSGWTLMPGSGGRVALLLIALALVQLICPLLFRDGTQWWVSGGVVASYGWTLLRQLLRVRKAVRS